MPELTPQQAQWVSLFSSPLFTSSEIEKLAFEAQLTDSIRHGSDLEDTANALLLKHLPSILYKDGWRVAHRSRRGSMSLYLKKTAPDGRTVEVRVSDHEVPETDERVHNRSMGFGPKWTDELLLNRDMFTWNPKQWREQFNTIYTESLEWGYWG